ALRSHDWQQNGDLPGKRDFHHTSANLDGWAMDTLPGGCSERVKIANGAHGWSGITDPLLRARVWLAKCPVVQQAEIRRVQPARYSPDRRLSARHIERQRANRAVSTPE